MNEGIAVAALVPARCGSKGLANKNLADLGGRSLLAWAIELALRVREIDRVIVSTDGNRIAAEARRLGAEVHPRPDHLATDTAQVADTVLDVFQWLRQGGAECQQLVLLQPTSPFRSVSTVSRCLRALALGADSAATFAPARLHPHRAFVVDTDRPRPFVSTANPWLPRQALVPQAFELTGSVYALWPERLPLGTTSLLFGDARAVMTTDPMVDIDDERDLVLANALLTAGSVQLDCIGG